MLIGTTLLRDGEHELKVTVTNPAGATSTVLRRTIRTNNRTTVSGKLTSDKPAPAAGSSAPPAPVYAVQLDAPTQKLVRGVRRGWASSALTLAGTMHNSLGVPAPGVLVTLFARNAGRSTAQPVARVTTDAAGHWLLIAPRGPSRVLAITYGEQPDPAAPSAIKIRQTVRPGLTLRVRALGRGRLRVTGRVHIKPLGTPRPLVVVQARNGRRWQAVGHAVRVRPSGTYTLVFNAGPYSVGGTYAFRAVAPSTRLFATGTSPIRKTRVR
jgi:5-hydroxyisourate hydrolase-like protein (transthyretin family)